LLTKQYSFDKKIGKLESSHYRHISTDLLENGRGSHGILGIRGVFFGKQLRGFHNPEDAECVSKAPKTSCLITQISPFIFDSVEIMRIICNNIIVINPWGIHINSGKW
jgi:hypothetical protein